MKVSRQETLTVEQPLRPIESRRAYLVVAFLLLVSAFVWSTWVFWPHLLDDTFIHLRYAENFLATGQCAYNIGQPSAGSSSPLYMCILAAIGRAFPRNSWPLIPKILSVVASAATITLLVIQAPTRSRGFSARLLAVFAVGAMLAVPSAARWLQDGMETSLAVLLAVCASVAAFRWRARSGPASWLEAVLVGVILAIPFMLRIDAFFTSLAALALCFLKPRARRWVVVAVCLALMAAWALYVRKLTGVLVPDTALSKRTGHFTPHFLVDFTSAMGSMSPLWVICIPLLLCAAAIRKMSLPDRLTPLLGLIPIAATIAGGMAVGQYVQGSRYFLPQLAFAWAVFSAWLRESYRRDLDPAPQCIAFALWAGAVLGVIHAIVFWPSLRKVAAGEIFYGAPELMRPGVRVMAADIGQLGWYTPSFVMDLSGLVNGTVIARTPSPDRPRIEIELMGPPDLLVIRDTQALQLGAPKQIDGNGPLPAGLAIVLHAKDGRELAYVDTGRVVKSQSNISQDLFWVLWKPR